MVTQRSAPAKGRYLELLGSYMPARNPKVTNINKERVAYWISKGAVPTDTVASLLKKEGVTDMDKYLEPRNKKRSQKGEEVKPAGAPPVTKTEAAAPAQTAAPAA